MKTYQNLLPAREHSFKVTRQEILAQLHSRNCYRGRVVTVEGSHITVDIGVGIPVFVDASIVKPGRGVEDNNLKVRVGRILSVGDLQRDEESAVLIAGKARAVWSFVPWFVAVADYPVGTVVEGWVRAQAHFGIFLDLDFGGLGLVRIVDMSEIFRVQMQDFPALGSFVTARVLGHNSYNEQVVLTMKPSYLSGERWERRMQRFNHPFDSARNAGYWIGPHLANRWM